MKKILIGVVIVIILIQFIPVNHDNPVSNPGNEIVVETDVKQILQNSCYDCHSNKTEWPLYSYVAPVSWLVSNHVQKGRRHLNFSEWGTYDPKRQSKKIKEIWDEVSEGEMPLTSYLMAHPKAKLSPNDISLLKEWAVIKGDSSMEKEEE